MNDLTVLLNRVGSGNVSADQLLPLVYEELRQVAARKMAREMAGQTLQATALVHEAWIRVGGGSQSWENRAHFFGAAAEAMRRILIDRARSKAAHRHGGGMERADFAEVEIVAEMQNDELLAVDEVLDEFGAHDPQKAELVKLRYFAGLTLEEAADVLKINVPTAKRFWAYARAWMFRKLKQEGHTPTSRSPSSQG